MSEMRRDTYMHDARGQRVFEGDIVQKLWGWGFCFGTEVADIAYHVIEAETNERGDVVRWKISGCSNLISGKDFVVVREIPDGFRLNEHVEIDVKTGKRREPSEEEKQRHREIADLLAKSFRQMDDMPWRVG